MTNNKEFDKRRFAHLILKIKGYRTLTKLSEDTGISIAHLSRMVNEKLASPPSPDTLMKLLNNNESSILYEELMIAAGYIHEIMTPTEITPASIVPQEKETTSSFSLIKNTEIKINEQVKRYKSLCMSTILFNLSCNGYSWNIISGRDITSALVNDFTLKLSNIYIDSWTFDLKYNPPNKDQTLLELETNDLVQGTWGRLASRPLDKFSKYSLVTDDEYLYNAFKAQKPLNLNLTISIILVHPEELLILKEEYLCFSHSIDINEMVSLLLI